MADLPRLDALDQRILGALLEKQRTVPATYPLSLNGLRSACNQTTSREPVTDHDEATIEQRCRELKARGLLRVVWAGKGSRVLKYHQLLEEELGLDDAGAALLAVLLLRGGQTAGELRARTERLHSFADRDAAETALRRLASAEPALVRELERRPGEKDRRWVHLLGPVAVGQPGRTASEPDGEGVLADGASTRDDRVRAAYETLARTYAADPSSQVTLPFERWLLDRVPDWADGFPVADLGCGPGHVAARLAASGADVVGYDSSPAMLAAARHHHPEVAFEQAGFAQFLRPRTAAGWGAVVLWFSAIHLAPSELIPLFTHLARTLRVGGHLLVALHAGTGFERIDHWLGQSVEVDLVLHDRTQVADAAATAGLVVVEAYQAALGTAHERLYVVARRDV